MFLLPSEKLLTKQMFLICFFIDEIQYMKAEELGALIAALHRSNQLGYPLMIVGAGLPKIYKMLADEKTYAERLFVYQEIGSLKFEQAKKAIEEPARKFNVTYTQEAVNKIAEISKGYPFFIQQLCQIVYQETPGSQITGTDVDLILEDFFETLDNGFFKVRYERCADSDKKFIFAMVKCGRTTLHNFQYRPKSQQKRYCHINDKSAADQ